jgi:haloacid dehalogenase-like hydrolase
VTTSDQILPSWRAGATRDAVVAFLDASASVPKEQRFACFDNDGTLWCERPSYVQLDFLIDALKTRVGEKPELADQAEFAALLGGDSAAMAEIGMERIAFALTGLFEGMPPQAFAARVREFMAHGTHSTLHRPLTTVVYQPMLELLTELRARDFSIAIVTGGGTEFVRAISFDLYEVPPELVVGTLIKYEFSRQADGQPLLLRTNSIEGSANEGAAKVTGIQTQLGRQPILGGGNSGGDREMLEWSCAGDGPRMALLVDHDDEEREFAYVGKAQSFVEPEPVIDVAQRLGWTIVSMKNDWETVFPA